MTLDHRSSPNSMLCPTSTELSWAVTRVTVQAFVTTKTGSKTKAASSNFISDFFKNADWPHNLTKKEQRVHLQIPCHRVFPAGRLTWVIYYHFD